MGQRSTNYPAPKSKAAPVYNLLFDQLQGFLGCAAAKRTAEKRREEKKQHHWSVWASQQAHSQRRHPDKTAQHSTAHDKLHAHHPQAWVCTHAISVIPNPGLKVRVTGRKESELEWNQG